MGLRILLISIIIIILFIILHNFVGRVVFKNDIPTLFGYGFNSLESSTIDGEYKMGDLVLVKKQEDYNVGDYIIYTKNEKELVELITDKTNNSYITVINEDGDTYELHKGFPRARIVTPIAKMGSFSSFLTNNVVIFIVVTIIIIFMFSNK